MTTPRKKPTSAMNHHRNTTRSPKTPTTTTKNTSKSPDFHRIFTENDEIQLLKTLQESPKNISFTSPNSNFTDTQISKKVSRLKEKYHIFARNKSRIKTPHDRNIYEIGRKIWGRKVATKEKGLLVENLEVSRNEEDVNLEDFPFLVGEMNKIFSRNDYINEGLRRLGKEKLKSMNEKWMELKLEESELRVKRVQLNHENLKLVVEGSKGCSSNVY